MLTSPRTIPPPQSCDTFVYVQAEATSTGTLFGKNSDRPSEERHEVTRIPHLHHKEGATVQCTYITVPQASETLECILSRPSWLWGCEMGANQLGVVGGNEAVNTLLADDLLSSDGTPTESLLGMDILRLALERGTSAKHAVDVCIHFLEAYGQGGPCCEGDSDWTYENSFLFADRNEAYVLETAGIRHWAWERISKGQYRNISNGISIRKNWGAVSKDIQSICKENGWWDGTEFDWKQAVDRGGSVEGLDSCDGREQSGLDHLRAIKNDSENMKTPQHPRWWVERMAGILRDEQSGICFRDRHGFCSTGSQISWLPTNSSERRTFTSRHFFSGASDPLCGTPYKLFKFSDPMSSKLRSDDHNTKKLWDMWRKRALSRTKLNPSQRDELSKMEESSFAKADATQPLAAFADLVKREIEVLESGSV